MEEGCITPLSRRLLRNPGNHLNLPDNFPAGDPTMIYVLAALLPPLGLLMMLPLEPPDMYRAILHTRGPSTKWAQYARARVQVTHASIARMIASEH